MLMRILLVEMMYFVGFRFQLLKRVSFLEEGYRTTSELWGF